MDIHYILSYTFQSVVSLKTSRVLNSTTYTASICFIQYLIIDEISMVGRKTFAMIDSRLRQAFPHKSTLTFGADLKMPGFCLWKQTCHNQALLLSNTATIQSFSTPITLLYTAAKHFDTATSLTLLLHHVPLYCIHFSIASKHFRFFLHYTIYAALHFPLYLSNVRIQFLASERAQLCSCSIEISDTYIYIYLFICGRTSTSTRMPGYHC